MHPPRKGKPFRCRTRSRVVALSRATLAMPPYATATKNFASNCDPKAGRGAGCRQSARFGSRSGFSLPGGQFPIGRAQQRQPIVVKIAEGVSH
jgi:hypothetical protein